MVNLDRFAQGRPDPQEKETEELDICLGCGEPITTQEEYLEITDGILHDEWECAYKYVKKQAW